MFAFVCVFVHCGVYPYPYSPKYFTKVRVSAVAAMKMVCVCGWKWRDSG